MHSINTHYTIVPPCLYHPLSLFPSLIGGSDYRLIYRHYATLYFVFCVDSSESDLGILDLIQVRTTSTCSLLRITFGI